MPPWTTARIALKGAWLAAIGAAVLALAAFAVTQSVRLNGFHLGPISFTGWIAEAGRFQGERDEERAAHSKTKADYRRAQDEAASLERARFEQVQAAQQEISDAIESDYRARIAVVRARADSLRQELQTRTGAGSAGSADAVPSLSPAAGGAAAAPGGPRLPAAGRADRELDRAIVATEQAIQLDSLIDWVRKQHAVDPNVQPKE